MSAMTDVKIPLQFDELRDESGSGFNISDMMDEDTTSPSDFVEMIEDFGMAVESEIELEQRHIDAMFNLVSCFKVLSDEQKGDFVGSLISMCTMKIDNLGEQSSTKSKNDFKIAHYFLHILSGKAELAAASKSGGGGAESGEKSTAKGKSKKSSEKFAWSEWRPAVLRLYQRALTVQPSAVWLMGLPEEAFLAGMWRFALQLLEDRPAGIAGAAGVEVALRALCSDIVLGCARQLAAASASGDELSTLCAAALDAVCRLEHMGPAVADLCQRENGRFAAQLMEEIGHMNLTDLGKSGSGVKNVGAFLVTMAEGAPRLMAAYFPTFIHLLDSEVYQIRSSIIHVMGSVVSYTHVVCAGAAAAPEAPAEGEDEDGPSSGRNQEQMKRVRDSILDMLVERTYDVSSYTRAAVLKTWATVAESGAIPAARFEAVAEVAVDRLQDRTAAVRRAAAALLASLLDNNPFGGVLDGAQFSAQQKGMEDTLRSRIERLRAELKAAQPAAPASASTPTSASASTPVSVKDEPIAEEEEKEGSGSEGEGSAAAEEEEEEEQVEITEDIEVVACRVGIAYCAAAARFIAAVAAAAPRVAQMLASKTVTDVVEALRFVARAVKFHLGPCAALLQSSFALVWHHEEGIRKECLLAFMNVYLTDGGGGAGAGLLSSIAIASNLVTVCVQCDASELASLERIIGELFRDQSLDAKVAGALWAMVCGCVRVCVAVCMCMCVAVALCISSHTSIYIYIYI
jgi:condensin complex subunit 1